MCAAEKAEGTKKAEGTTEKAAYTASRALLSEKTEREMSWRKALIAAREASGDLPDYEDWYQSLQESSSDAALERAGHYEWVLPWVYDTASHGRYNQFFRGRFQGCDYMDLSPQNNYHYRIALPRSTKTDKSGGQKP